MVETVVRIVLIDKKHMQSIACYLLLPPNHALTRGSRSHVALIDILRDLSLPLVGLQGLWLGACQHFNFSGRCGSCGNGMGTAEGAGLEVVGQEKK